MMKNQSPSPLFEPDGDNPLNAVDNTTQFSSTEIAPNPVPVAQMYPGASCVKVPPQPAMSTAEPQSVPSEKKKRNASGTDSEIEARFDQLDKDFHDADLRDLELQYDPSCEPLPQLAQYSAAFVDAERQVKDLVQKVHSHIFNNVERDSETAYMLERLRDVETPAYSPSQFVGVLGNSGVGKSTLINGIMGIEGLCLTSDADAGTLVPMELAQMSDDQPTPYAGYIDLFPLETCIEIIKMALKDYFNQFLARNEESSRDTDEIDLGTPALKSLLALFADQPSFMDATSAEEFLNNMESPDDPSILATLLQWTRELYETISRLLNKGPFLAHTPNELNEKLEPFVQTALVPHIEIDQDTFLEVSIWPFVKLARVYFSHPILTKNIILVDLPGVSDSNVHRVRHTKLYLRRCDVTFVVHTNTRAGDDTCVKRYVLDVWRRKKSGGVAVVITQTDKIANGKNVRVTHSLQEQEYIITLSEHEKNINTQLKQIRVQLKTAARQKSTHTDHVKQLQEKEELYGIHLYHIAAMKKQILVTARNRQVKQELRSWYRSKTKDTHDLDVFCVSSETYMNHLEPYSKLQPPELDVELTGMPQLRHFILTLPGRTGKAETLAHHCGAVVHSVLNQISLSCSGFRPMMKRDLLNKFIVDAQTNIPSISREIRQGFQRYWIEPMLRKMDACEATWISRASELCDRWAKWNPHGYLSFLRHEGAWKTAACGQADWNRELLKAVVKDVRPMFNEICDKDVNKFQQELLYNVSEVLDKMERQIKSKTLDIAHLGAFREFFEIIRNQKKDVEMHIKNANKALVTELQHLRSESLTNSQDNPFTKYMGTIYGRSFQAQPTKEIRSKHAIRAHTFKSSVLQEKLGPYAEIRNYIEDQIEDLLQILEKDLLTKCDSVFESILHDFNSVCPRHENDSDQALKRRGELGNVVDEAKKELDSVVRKSLGECGLSMD